MENEKEVEEILLGQCLIRVEEKLNWGNSQLWKTKDFETLSEKIFQETKVTLSIATLKRLWGKMKYDSKPTIATLDAIAQFAGHQNWRAFVQSQSLPKASYNGHQTSDDKNPVNGINAVENSSIPKTSTKPFLSKRSSYIALGVVIFVVLGGYLWFTRKTEKSHYDPAHFNFSSKKIVSEGVPNSVVFSYDAHNASREDTIVIQQSWDSRLQQQVPYDQRQATSIYYYPGFFQAKLIVNDQIVKEHNLQIMTQGWLPLVEQSNIPVYYLESEAQRNGQFGLSMEQITSKNIAYQQDLPWVRYYNVRDFGDLMVGNFSFKTEIKNDYKEGAGICQLSEIIVLYESNAINIPLSIKGCVSKLSPEFDNSFPVNLEALGCDFSDWVTVVCKVENGQGSVNVNDVLAYNFNVTRNERIIGLCFRFQGTGSIRSCELRDESGRIAFEDKFN